MRWGLFALALGLLAPQIAFAETLEVDRFEPATLIELLGVQGIDIDTGWQPPSGNIQVSFLLHADDNVVADLPGDAIYDWDTHELYFVGDDGEGYFGVDIGVELDGRFRFDLLGQQFESSIIGPYDLGVFDEAQFTPYLLEGNPTRPAHIDTETTPIEVFDYAIVDAIIASGSFFVDANFDVDMRLACDRIEVLVDGRGTSIDVTTELQTVNVAPVDEGDDLDLEATLHCTLQSDVELVLYPGVELQIGFEEFQLVPLELRIPLLDDREDPIGFEPVALHFDAPPPPFGDESSSGGEDGSGSGDTSSTSNAADSDGGADGDGDGGAGDASSVGPQTTGVADAGTETDSAAAGDSTDGCGCSSSPPSPANTSLLVMMAALGLRRRRRLARQGPPCKR